MTENALIAFVKQYEKDLESELLSDTDNDTTRRMILEHIQTFYGNTSKGVPSIVPGTNQMFKDLVGSTQVIVGLPTAGSDQTVRLRFSPVQSRTQVYMSKPVAKCWAAGGQVDNVFMFSTLVDNTPWTVLITEDDLPSVMRDVNRLRMYLWPQTFTVVGDTTPVSPPGKKSIRSNVPGLTNSPKV